MKNLNKNKRVEKNKLNIERNSMQKLESMLEGLILHLDHISDDIVEFFFLERYKELLAKCPPERRQKLVKGLLMACGAIALQYEDPSFALICEDLLQALKKDAEYCGFKKERAIIFIWGVYKTYEKIGAVNLEV